MRRLHDCPCRDMAERVQRFFALLTLVGLSSCAAGQVANPSLLEQQAESANQPRQVKEAIAAYGGVLAREPSNARALAHRAGSFLLIGRSDLALNDVDKAIALDGGTFFAFTVKALAEQNTLHGKDRAFSDASRAIELLRNPHSSKPDTDNVFVVLDAEDRNFAATAAYTLRAEIRKERKQFDLARADVDAIIDVDPDMTSAWVIRASIEREQGEFTAALRDDMQAFGQHSHAEQAVSGLCGDYAALGPPDIAVRRCSEALVTAPANYMNYVNRGLARLKSGAVSEARADFEQAIVAAPDSSYALFGRGLAQIGEGHDIAGRAEITRVNAMDAAAARWFKARGVGAPVPHRT